MHCSKRRNYNNGEQITTELFALCNYAALRRIREKMLIQVKNRVI